MARKASKAERKAAEKENKERTRRDKEHVAVTKYLRDIGKVVVVDGKTGRPVEWAQ